MSTQNNVCSQCQEPLKAKNTITLGQYDPQKLAPKNETRVIGRIYGMNYSWKGYKDRGRHKNRIKEWTSSVVLCLKHEP